MTTGANVPDRKSPSGPLSTAGNLVTSVFGRIGDVIALFADYSTDLIENVSTVAGVTLTNALEDLSDLQGDTVGPHDNNTVESISPDVGGPNINLGDFTSDAAEIRPVVRQAAGGDVETVSIATLAAAIGTLDTEFDFIITDRQSLIDAVGAPVGGVFTLVTGSYAFKQALTLNAGERLEASGAAVLLMGVGPTKKVNGDTLTAPLLTVSSGTVQLLTFSLDSNTAGQPAMLQSGGKVTAYDCTFTGGTTSDGVQVTGGQWFSVLGAFEGGRNGFRQDGSSAASVVRMNGGTIEGAFSDACWRGVGNGNDIRAYISNMTFENSSSAPVVECRDATSGDFYFFGCSIRSSAANQNLIEFDDISTFVCDHCDIVCTNASRGDGVVLSGVIGGGGIINACTLLDLDDAIKENGLSDIERCVISSNDFGGTMTNGIDWDSGDLPQDGLLIVGNNFGPANPFSGFNENTSNVNAKCNSESGGLVAETSIVP